MTDTELLKRYPFLKQVNADGSTYNLLLDMPNGWKKAFGELLCEDILNACKEDNVNFKKFQIDEIKEKFGRLSVYYHPNTDKISKIIQAYSVISKNVCIHCGKLDVPIQTKGWIHPSCFDCCKKFKNFANTNFNDTDFDNKSTISESYIHKSYKNGEMQEEIVDISDYVKKVRLYNDTTN